MTRTRKTWAFAAVALAAAIVLAGLVSPFASSAPDGLEKVARDKGFAEKGEGAPAWRLAPAAEYEMPGVRSAALRTGLAGIAGTLAVFGAALSLARALRRKEKAQDLPRTDR